MKQKRYSGVLVNYNDKFLLCKRNLKDSYPGVWSIPGGQIENGEESLEAAVREFFEETSIDLDSGNLKFIGIVPRNTDLDENHLSYMYIYYINSDDKIIPNLDLSIDGQEHTECGYFSLKDMENMDVDKDILQLLQTMF